MKPLIRAIYGAAMTRADVATIEDVLHGKLNVGRSSSSSDFDAIP
jgi:hypothetical protein